MVESGCGTVHVKGITKNVELSQPYSNYKYNIVQVEGSWSLADQAQIGYFTDLSSSLARRHPNLFANDPSAVPLKVLLQDETKITHIPLAIVSGISVFIDRKSVV